MEGSKLSEYLSDFKTHDLEPFILSAHNGDGIIELKSHLFESID